MRSGWCVIYLIWKWRIVNHCSVQPYYSGSWVVYLLTSNLAMGATITHLMIWNFDDLVGAWSWLSPSSIKSMYRNFNWRFWKDDGMRNEDDKETDPHYREMLKVIVCVWIKTVPCLVLTDVQCCDSTPMPQTVGILWPFSFLLSCHLPLSTRLIRLCHGKSSLFPNPLYFNSLFQVGILDFTPSGGSIYPFFRGLICHYRIGFHYPTVYSGKNLLTLEDYIIVQQTSRWLEGLSTLENRWLTCISCCTVTVSATCSFGY